MHSECGNLTSLFTKPDEDLLIAGIAAVGLWATRDGGMTWNALGAGTGSAMIINRPTSLLFDPDPAHINRFWEAGIYNSGGAYETSDDGTTFVEVGMLHHCDSLGVDFTDPNRSTVLVGAHEQSQTLYLSTDGGMTFTNIGQNLPAMMACTFPIVIDANTFLLGCGEDGAVGVLRSVDKGAHWTVASMSGGSGVPVHAQDGSYYWASTNGGPIVRSTDNGQNWNPMTSPGAVTSLTIAPIELPDGRIATFGPEYGTQYVLVSADQGMTWKAGSAALPYADARGLVYSKQQKAFFVWHFTCDGGPNDVPADAVMRFDFDYQTQ
jgi:hypothetical protein